MIDCHMPLFDGSLNDLDSDKTDLIFWIKFYYHTIFTKTEEERPTDFVVNYDILLDEWLKNKDSISKTNVTNANNMEEVIHFN